MSDTQRLYAQHDELEERVRVLREDFEADAQEFGGWDAEEDAIDKWLASIERRLEEVHDLIQDLDQDEIDRAKPDSEPKGHDPEQSKKLIARIERELADVEDDLKELDEALAAWRRDNDGDDPDRS